MAAPDKKLAAKWERILASHGLEQLRPGTRTPKEQRDTKARKRRRNRAA